LERKKSLYRRKASRHAPSIRASAESEGVVSARNAAVDRHSMIFIPQCGNQIGCARRSPLRGKASKRDTGGCAAEGLVNEATNATAATARTPAIPEVRGIPNRRRLMQRPTDGRDTGAPCDRIPRRGKAWTTLACSGRRADHKSTDELHFRRRKWVPAARPGGVCENAAARRRRGAAQGALTGHGVECAQCGAGAHGRDRERTP